MNYIVFISGIRRAEFFNRNDALDFARISTAYYEVRIVEIATGKVIIP